jgi:RNA polymerase sigma-70 factor (ECF subfamily)
MVPTTERVWEEFNVGLKHFILKRVPDEPSAEDILQDVFLKIHVHIDTLREQDKLQSWIYQIARFSRVGTFP